MTRLVCVLRSGGEYGVEHVDRLQAQVRRHNPDAELTCMTDVPAAIRHVDRLRGMRHHWPGWFAKIEALKIAGPVLMMDLDVTVVGDLGPLMDLATRTDFAMCRGFWGARDPNKFNSSVMMWRADAPAHIADLFATDPERYVREGRRRDNWGDQGFIARRYGGEIAAVQDLAPGMVLSYKRDVLRGASTADMRICVSHGMPRPWGPDGADRRLATGICTALPA